MTSMWNVPPGITSNPLTKAQVEVLKSVREKYKYFPFALRPTLYFNLHRNTNGASGPQPQSVPGCLISSNQTLHSFLGGFIAYCPFSHRS